MNKRYNLLQGEKIILSAVSAQEIKKYLGRPGLKISDYVKRGHVANKKIPDSFFRRKATG